MSRTQLSLLLPGILLLGALLAVYQVSSVPDVDIAPEVASAPEAASAPAVTESTDAAAIAVQSWAEQIRAIVPGEVTIIEIVEIDGSNDLRITGWTDRNRAIAELLRAIDELGLVRSRFEILPSDEGGGGVFTLTVGPL